MSLLLALTASGTSGSATGSLAGSWSLRASGGGALSGQWSLRNAAAGTTSSQWSLLNAQTGAAPGAWSIAASAAGAFSSSWSISSAQTALAIFASGWTLRNNVASSYSAAWSVQGDVPEAPPAGGARIRLRPRPAFVLKPYLPDPALEQERDDEEALAACGLL